MPQPKVIISSTARDLPEHRKEVMDACLRQSMFPTMMEHLPASDADAIKASLKLVNEADIYVGVFAHRYGYVPAGHDISITEMEYNHAVERDIPRQIFVMDKTHPITIDDVEQGEGAIKLKAFKERVQTENIVNFFDSPDDLRANVINSLSQFRHPDLTTFHYVSEIPEPPEVFIAHTYTLLQTHRLVGRKAELNLLTDWVAKPDSEVYGAHILSIIAMGGLGKSALTWKWFNDIAPQEMKPLAGRMWWSFFERDAIFENFIARALAYVTRKDLGVVQTMPAGERETQLLAALKREPFLIVLDGLERILTGYARADAAGPKDQQKNLRKTADPNAGHFLKELAQVNNSRVLISSRHYPADLETQGQDPMWGSYRYDLSGLTDDDAVELWRAFKVAGSRDMLLQVFATFGKLPLLIQALAGEVNRYRRAPGDFEKWRKANPQFDPAKSPHLKDAMNHVLEFTLPKLGGKARQTLQVISAFRMPRRYDTLAALLIGEGKPCADERELDEVLNELEDRGLVGWDRRANRYDMHPVVRGVVWGGLGDETRHVVYTDLSTHLEALAMSDNPQQVTSLEDLAPAIDLYVALIGLERYDDAVELFYERLDDATLYRLEAISQRIDLLLMLFPDGLDQPPRLSEPIDQGFTLNALALTYKLSGELGLAASLFHRHNTISSEIGRFDNLSVGLNNLSGTLGLSGKLWESEAAARSALVIARQLHNAYQEAVNLYSIGLRLATRNFSSESECALRRSLRIFQAQSLAQMEGVVNLLLAQRAVQFGQLADASSFAGRAWELAQVEKLEGDLIRAALAQGEGALGLNDFVTADERLRQALTRARAVNHVEEELPALVALAELRRRQRDVKAARGLLDDLWEATERGPYPLVRADAFNVLAQIERDEGNEGKATEAARKAYELAWCDGPPFAYHWGLERARGHLRELGAGEPVMPAFDEGKFEAMPEVEIDPEDEFHAGS